MKDVGLKTRPPRVTVGVGGPPATPIAHELRALRDTAVAARLALRRGKGDPAFSPDDRERRIEEFGVHIKFLSEQIREAERADR